MAIARPPTDERAADGLPLDRPAAPPVSPGPEPFSAEAPPPPAAAAPAPPFGPAQGPARPRPAGDRVLWPLILIALGVVFLIGNVVADFGSLLFLALGAAFLVARVIQREYGFAVPAGVLFGFGTFVALSANGWLVDTGTDTAQGGWFFILLGAGFLAVYLIGARPALIWPLFPAAILVGFGMLLLGADTLAWFARFEGLVNLWPLVLVGLGLWLLLRNRLARPLRRPVGTIALALLLVYSLALLAGVVAASGLQLGNSGSGLRGLGFRPPISGVVELRESLAAGGTFRVDNASGNTTIRPGAPGAVAVTATTYRWTNDQTIDVRLTPDGDTVTLAATTGAARYFGNTPSVDYIIAVPPDVRVEVTSASGNVAIDGLGGAVVARTSSGGLSLDNIAGAVTAQSSSGNVRLTNIAGAARATTSSGNINATGIADPREFIATSGNVTVEGRFVGQARITASSGNVTVRFAPESAVRIAATVSSGDIRVRELTLTERSETSRSLRATLGAGTGALDVQTSSGNITLDRAR